LNVLGRTEMVATGSSADGSLPGIGSNEKAPNMAGMNNTKVSQASVSPRQRRLPEFKENKI